MKPKNTNSERELFGGELAEILNHKHPLYILATKIDWALFEKEIDSCYARDVGRPGVSTRLMVGLLYLKHAFNESDETVLARWLENPYWQFFCGEQYLQHALPIDDSSLSRWRTRVGAERIEKLLAVTLQTAIALQAIRPHELAQVNVDTTVQEKAIAFPTDARLYHKMRLALVRRAKQLNLLLRQTYTRVGKRMMFQQSRYAHAQQFKRAANMSRKLKTILGRVVRDIERKAPRTKTGNTAENTSEIADDTLRELVARAHRLLTQTRASKQKLYSVHAPEVECIAKGKIHKRYEFGCKVSIATTSQSNWIVGTQALHGNPYDGHTLHAAIEQVTRLTKSELTDVMVDQGYRGHGYIGSALVHVVKTIPRTATRAFRRMLKRRAAIEPTIGHLKSDHRLERNHLHGTTGDKINAFLAAAGYNLRKLLRWILFRLIFSLWSHLLSPRLRISFSRVSISQAILSRESMKYSHRKFPNVFFRDD